MCVLISILVHVEPSLRVHGKTWGGRHIHPEISDLFYKYPSSLLRIDAWASIAGTAATFYHPNIHRSVSLVYRVDALVMPRFRPRVSPNLNISTRNWWTVVTIFLLLLILGQGSAEYVPQVTGTETQL